MRPDNSRYLIQSAQRRHEDALTRTRGALRDLDRAGEQVTFRAVAAAAGQTSHRAPGPNRG
jgi:hypothetical protein